MHEAVSTTCSVPGGSALQYLQYFMSSGGSAVSLEENMNIDEEGVAQGSVYAYYMIFSGYNGSCTHTHEHSLTLSLVVIGPGDSSDTMHSLTFK